MIPTFNRFFLAECPGFIKSVDNVAPQLRIHMPSSTSTPSLDA